MRLPGWRICWKALLGVPLHSCSSQKLLNGKRCFNIVHQEPFGRSLFLPKTQQKRVTTSCKRDSRSNSSSSNVRGRHNHAFGPSEKEQPKAIFSNVEDSEGHHRQFEFRVPYQIRDSDASHPSLSREAFYCLLPIAYIRLHELALALHIRLHAKERKCG